MYKRQLYDGPNNKLTIRFDLGLFDDRHYIDTESEFYGFTNEDIGKDEYDGTGMSIKNYLRQEKKIFMEFKKQLKVKYESAGGEGKKTVMEMKKFLYKPEKQFKTQELSNTLRNGRKMHMYRAPQNCILICDEIHQVARPSKSIRRQVLWKYILGCKHTIMASATPVESKGSELQQLYLLSQMLRTDRKRAMSEAATSIIGGKYKGEFLPPWHLLRQQMPENLNMYQVAAKMKNKFSRYNTVQNIDDSVSLLFEKTPDDDKFSNDDTEIMNAYLGTELKEKKWVLQGGKLKGSFNGEKIPSETGKFNYKIRPEYYNQFARKALEQTYFNQKLSSDRKLFPDLIPYGSEGFIEVPLDPHRVYMRDLNPEYLYQNQEDDVYTNLEVKKGKISIVDNSVHNLSLIHI